MASVPQVTGARPPRRSFVGGAWRILVGVKDVLVLIFLLLFFGLIWAALSSRPNAGAVTPGALLVELDGALVEQPEEAAPFASLAGGSTVKQHRLRDVVRGIEAAAGDSRIKAVVLDLDQFLGGGAAALARVGAALDTVKRANKPVLAYATGYGDDGYRLAAHATEVWTDPLGGALFAGPGGSRLYFKGLIDRLGINAHVYRVGTYKSFVEPFTLTQASPEAKQADQALADALWRQWQDEVTRARPKARIAEVAARPAALAQGTGGDLAQAALRAGLVDKLGDRTAFGERVAAVAGAAAADKPAGSFAQTTLANWIAANPVKTSGDAIGVVTVAGNIVDGVAGPGTAGGETISKLLLEGAKKHRLKALVVRVDSPGGSSLASERIRQAILKVKAQRIPVVVSMGSVAASGGYWVATPGDRIFAEPSTITGSIGVFGLIPTFETSLARIGVTSDGVRTTPLSGQPDVVGGTNAEFDQVIQASIEATYRRFVGMVAQARKLTPQRVDEIAQGRVWDGGTARQIGLVDRFGSLDDAVAEAARLAGLDPGKVRPVYLEKEPDWASQLFAGWSEPAEEESADAVTRLARKRFAALASAVREGEVLLEGPVVRAYCLECPRDPRGSARTDQSMLRLLIAWATR